MHFFFPQWKLLNHWFQNWHKICSDLPQTACVMRSSALGNGVNTFLKKQRFRQFTVNIIWIQLRQEKNTLKKLDKENEGMNNVLFVGMTYIISLATAVWHSVRQSVLCHLGCLKVTVSYGNKGKNDRRKSSNFSMLGKYFKTQGPAGFHGSTRAQNGITFSFISYAMF